MCAEQQPQSSPQFAPRRCNAGGDVHALAVPRPSSVCFSARKRSPRRSKRTTWLAPSLATTKRTEQSG